jgi:hypothetical protein
MKKLILLLFLAPLFVAAQDCKLRKEIDQFSQLPKLTSGFAKFDADVPFQLSVDATKTDITFFFLLKNGSSSCFDDQSTLVLTFEGNRKVTLRNAGTMNCEGYFQLTYRNTATTSAAVKRLTTQKINVLTFTSGKTVTTINLTVEQKDKFQKMATCIANEAPSLLKP